MGKLSALVLLATLVVTSATAATEFGFRLLRLDGSVVRWASMTRSPVSINYALLSSARHFADARNCRDMVPIDALLEASRIDMSNFRRELRLALDMWQAVANIEFIESDVASAGILVGAQSIAEGRAYADVTYGPRDDQVGDISRALVCLNPRIQWKVGFDGNLAVYDLRYTLAHEIGHAIGLDHPHSQGQVMSFRYQEQFRDLQLGDVSGVVRLYGIRH